MGTWGWRVWSKDLERLWHHTPLFPCSCSSFLRAKLCLLKLLPAEQRGGLPLDWSRGTVPDWPKRRFIATSLRSQLVVPLCWEPLKSDGFRLFSKVDKAVREAQLKDDRWLVAVSG